MSTASRTSIPTGEPAADVPAGTAGTAAMALDAAPADGAAIPTTEIPSHAAIQAVADLVGQDVSAQTSGAISATAAPPVSAQHGRGIIARNFLSLGVAALIGQLVAMVSNIYASRVLGVESVGQVAWTAAIISYFALMINPGLETIAKREVAREPDAAPQFVSTLLVLQILLAIGTLGLVVGFAALKPRGPEISLLLLLQAISLVIAPFNLGWVLHAHERMSILAVGDVIVQILTLPALLLLVHDPSHADRYILVAYPFRIGLLCFTFWYVQRHHLIDWRQVNFSPLAALKNSGWLIKQAIPLGLSQAAILIYYNSDSIFLGFMKDGNQAVGYYTRAYRLMTMATFLSSALLSSYFPSLSRASKDASASKRSSAQFLRILAWIGFPCAMFGWALGRYAVQLLYGPEFAASGPLFEWLSLDVALIFFNVGIGQPLTAWGHQGTVFRITLLGAAVNLGLNFVFIPWLGPMGAVITTILAEVAVFVASIVIRRRIVPIAWWALTYKPFICCIATGCMVKLCVMRFDKTMWPALLLGVVVLSGCFLIFERRTAMPLLDKIVRRFRPSVAA